MPPKNKAKKGKKGADDDEHWAQAGESVPSKITPAADLSDEESQPKARSKGKGNFSGFAALQMDDIPEPAAAAEEEEDFGGLMSTIKASKGKKDKKKPKKVEEPLDDELPEDGEMPVTGKGPVQMTAEELADEEWGPVKEKGKKAKKGKGKKGKAVDDDDDQLETGTLAPGESAAPAPTPAAAAVAAPSPAPDGEEAEEDEDGGPKVLSKKEKEKLKKDREKAKKKAQAAAKKGAEGGEEAAPVVEESKKEDDAEEAEGAEGTASKKKKKKKGKGSEETAAPAAAAPAAAGGKKKGALGALKAMMEEKKRLEEEARQQLEAERKRIEEEQRLEEEAEKKKEEERQRKKEKEKAKKEQARKDGTLLTKKQKEEKAAAERRKEALLKSGVHIEGLQASGDAPPAKKVVYSNRKKKGPTAAAAGSSAQASPAVVVRALSPEPTPEATPQATSAAQVEQLPATIATAAANEDVKSDWDASSDEEVAAPAKADMKESWDASSGEEDEAPAAKPASVAKPSNGKKPNQKANGAPPAKAAPAANKATVKPAGPAKKGVQPAAVAKEEEEEESSEEEDDSEDEDSDEDSDESSEEESSSDEEMTQAQVLALQRKAEAAERRAKAHEAALAARNKDDLRSPICCILGHVDTGKTKLLDKIRQTNVQEGEAGGITQQIGATFFPVDAIQTKTMVLNKDGKQEYKIPGLLVIDTPGHESFSNLRSRGSSLCNIAVLVVDIMHGLEPQTLESLRLLRDKKTPFIVALNKIDRLYGWEATPDGAFQESLAKQKLSVQREFADRVEKTELAFAEQGLNAVLYYNNKNLGKNVSLVPTSAITGEGVPDMIMLLVNLTQQRMNEKLMYLSELECTVLEVKVIEGLGTTIDVVLSNGILREGDRIVVCGLNGPIATTVRALLTPQPLRELRIKSAYVHNKEVKAALGVKISATDLEKAIAGSRLLVVGPDDDEDDLKEEVMSDLTSLLNTIDKSGRGVCVQASTLGSLEALLDFLKTSKIPVSGINIGPVHKKDIMRSATMLEKAKELACILCFDVPVDKEAEKMAEEMGIRLFKADIIYHLFDAFTLYNAEITEAKRKDAAPSAVWPCRLKIIAAFCKRDPIILGVDIIDGTLRVGTPICVVKTDPATGKKDIIDLGKITSLEINHKTHDMIKKSQAGGGVAVKIEHAVYQSAKMFGRHFEEKDELLSHVTRASIDVLKNTFKADVSMEEWVLIKNLKPLLDIQ